MLLVDTSVWIDFFAGKNSVETNFVATYIENRENLCVCGPILTEILQGIKTNVQYDNVVKSLDPLIYLEMSRKTYVLAADIFRKLRSKGVTVRKMVDCMIAAVAIENNLPLLHKDCDFKPIEKYCQLKAIYVARF